ncbi:hypothetical protein Poly30_39020 [Planctomycetes bacterium Poly30]|uniref:SbsA Ig-like domain-containing protein n=1 Tax=Saltatorellus ferox TaxID=2528018 RepID=A0A518EWA4_9BACT|nr:hypothetical protein Poly30_39020 [Planctomycetes bacterium Poly30]
MRKSFHLPVSPQGITANLFPGAGRRGRVLATGVLCASLAGLGLSGCSGASGVEPTSADNPSTGSSFYFGDLNSGGAASEFRIARMAYGRLVQVQALDNEGIRQTMASDFVINQNLVSDDLNYELTVSGVTGQETLFIKRNVDIPAQREQFLDLLKAAGEGLDPIQVQDLATTGTYSMLPRNAALVIVFDDLVRPSTVSNRTIEIVEGYPPTAPFEARVFPSAHYGGTASNGAFYPTRVIVDLTTSLIEKQLSGSSAPLNGVGLGASIESNMANVQVRIPTVTNPSIGLTNVLTNLTNHALATTGNGPVDFTTNSRPVTRALRSGGRAGIVSDPFNGFLRDTLPPQVLGATPMNIVAAPQQVQADPADTGSLFFILPEVELPSELCGRDALTSADFISQPGLFARVVKPAGLTPTQAQAYVPDGSGMLFNLPVELVSFPREWDGPKDWEQFGAIQSNLEVTFELGDPAECFVQVLPRPTGYPNNPTDGVTTSSIFTLRFSEPMDPESLTAFDSVTLTRQLQSSSGAPLSTSDFVVGELNQSATLREVTFVPVLNLAHLSGVQESYYFSLSDSGDAFPPRDLAGNIVAAIPSIEVTVEPSEPSELNGGRVSRFASTDEEVPLGGFPEWGGQIQIDTNLQTIRPRPVVRTQVVIDNQEQALPAQMTAFPPGVVTPFSPFGSKMQTVWRYSDCGFSLTDPNNINIDVEGLWWVPTGGSINPDAFERFEIRLSHCRYAPDELINPSSLFPQFQNSGLRPVYTVNILENEVQRVVHPRQLGYVIDQADVRTTVNGTSLVPFPLNRNVPDEDKRYFTWRDTRIRDRSGPGNGGLESEAYSAALGLPPAPNLYYRPGEIQTIGLPLLMEFRTSVDLSSAGQNAWLLNLAVNSSSRPYFRAFSTGGVNTGGDQVFIDPENEDAANGGFSPGSNPPGAPTFGRDNTFHLGAIDYVARISLAHSIWFEAVIESEGASSFGGRVYSEPTVEPDATVQPIGTSVEFSFRGATNIVFDNTTSIPGAGDNYSGGDVTVTGELADYQYDASTLDLYGDYYNDKDITDAGGSPVHNPNQDRDNFGISFLPGFTDQAAWRDSVTDIFGARYYQVRITFSGNVITGQAPQVSAFALTWERP